ncbi:MAG: glycosyltransferase family 4 protein [Candidatus Moraniibacteriota bacterium]
MKKILLITRPIAPPWDEASKIFAYNLAKDAKGFEFSVLTPGKIEALPKHIQQIPIYTSNHPNLKLDQQARLLKLIPLIKNFDLVHFMLTPNKLNALGFKLFLTRPSVKTVQTVATLREDLFADKDFKKILFADLIVTYSDYAKNKLTKLGLKNVMRVYPGINLQNYCPAPKNLHAMEMFGIAQTDFVISYPGEYTRLGATDDIASMLPKLFEKIPNAKFIFANRLKNEKDALKKAQVVETLKKAGVLDKVVFTDTFGEMPKIYNLSDVVIFPARDMKGKFDVPLVVIEAMACAKPVIISNLPILQEFSSNKNAVMIDPTKENELLEAILDLFENPKKCAKIGETAKQYATANFGIREVAKQYEQAYHHLLS